MSREDQQTPSITDMFTDAAQKSIPVASAAFLDHVEDAVCGGLPNVVGGAGAWDLASQAVWGHVVPVTKAQPHSLALDICHRICFFIELHASPHGDSPAA